MTGQVVLQPCAAGIPMSHFEDTIRTPVAFEAHADLLDPATLAQLHSVAPDGRIAMWRIVPNNKVVAYRRMEIGDTALFTSDGKGFYTATVAVIFHNPPSLKGCGAATRTSEHGSTCMPWSTVATSMSPAWS